MKKYRVELSAWLEATFVMEVEAEDATVAKQYAVEHAPTDAEMWTVLPSPSPKSFSVFSCEEQEG
jgi:hypothetical protein